MCYARHATVCRGLAVKCISIRAFVAQMRPVFQRDGMIKERFDQARIAICAGMRSGCAEMVSVSDRKTTIMWSTRRRSWR